MKRTLPRVFAIGLAIILTSGIGSLATAQEAKPKPSVLITNARIFDGQSQSLAEGMSVLVEGNPLKDLKAVTDSDNLKIIMKDGKIFKNTVN